MGNAVFRGMPAPRPLDRFLKKNGTVDYVGDSTPRARIGINRFKGGVFAHAWNCHPQASIFLVLMVHAHRYRLDRSLPLTAQMTRPRGVHVLFMVSLIRKIFFLIFNPKMWKIALHPMGTLNSYNFGIVEDTCKLFAFCFRGRAIEWCHSNLPQTDPCCHGNQS